MELRNNFAQGSGCHSSSEVSDRSEPEMDGLYGISTIVSTLEKYMEKKEARRIVGLNKLTVSFPKCYYI